MSTAPSCISLCRVLFQESNKKGSLWNVPAPPWLLCWASVWIGLFRLSKHRGKEMSLWLGKVNVDSSFKLTWWAFGLTNWHADNILFNMLVCKPKSSQMIDDLSKERTQVSKAAFHVPAYPDNFIIPYLKQPPILAGLHEVNQHLPGWGQVGLRWGTFHDGAHQTDSHPEGPPLKPVIKLPSNRLKWKRYEQCWMLELSYVPTSLL